MTTLKDLQKIVTVNDSQKAHNTTIRILKENPQQAQNHMQQLADHQITDLVFLCLLPYRQTMVTTIGS